MEGASTEGALSLLGSRRILDQLLFIFITLFVVVIILALLNCEFPEVQDYVIAFSISLGANIMPRM